MSFKTIVVSLNDVERLETVFRFAFLLARQHDAHLTGVYVIPAPQTHTDYAMYGGVELPDPRREFFKEKADGVRQKFEAEAASHDVRVEYREVEGKSYLLASSLIDHALQADLIVASQIDPDGSSVVENDYAERLVMESGRPVLLTPFASNSKTIGTNVIVGWNATRESARATFDALPILERSNEVRLVWVNPERQPVISGNVPGSEMATALARHGVKATADAVPKADLSAADVLLNRSSDVGADLIVMGAYGHSRMREFIFGGATRHLLDHMTVPVLMSH